MVKSFCKPPFTQMSQKGRERTSSTQMENITAEVLLYAKQPILLPAMNDVCRKSTTGSNFCIPQNDSALLKMTEGYI